MRVIHRVLAAAGAAVALALSGAPGAASGSPLPHSQPGTASTGPVIRTGTVIRFNVGATHSPEVDHLLAGQAGTSPLAGRQAGLPAAASTVQGIDVASLQHPNGAPINWSDVAQAGYKFAFIKVSEGSYYVNPYYAADAAGAQAADMFAAPYAFAIPNYSGGALQADYALDNAGYAPDGRLLPPILDIEYDPYAGGDGTTGFCYGLTPAQMVAWIGAFGTEIQRRTGQRPVIYSTAQWWDTCTADSTAFSADPLWIADYGTSSPALPAAWQNWMYWQYTDSATVPGISVSRGTDASYLSSTALELAAPASQSNRVGSQVSLQANALDAAAPVTYSATGLPPGIQISATTGAVSGKLPAVPGAFPVVIQVSAPGEVAATQHFSWYVHGRVRLARLVSQTGSLGVPVRYQVRERDGIGGCTLQFSATGLPPGLVISSCGMISGWPVRAGNYAVTIRAADSSGAIVARGSVGWRVRRANGSGPAGHVQLRRDGKCLAERSPTDIAIETCSRATAERWTIATDGSVRVGGKCLAARRARGSAPAALALTSCTGGQRWQLDSNAVLTYLSTGRCLADTGNRNGARAVAAVCQATPNATGSASTPSPSQQWTLPAGPLTSGVAGYCASTVRPAGGPAGAVTLRLCASLATQAWTIEPDGALSAGGKCLRTVSATAPPGTLLHLAHCVPGAADQVWQLSGGPVGVQLVSPAAGLCVADPGDAARAGIALRIGPCVASDIGTWWRVS